MKVEVLTTVYYDTAKDLYRQASLIDDNNYFKVLSVGKKELKVIYISKKNKDICLFSENNDEWVLEEWNTLYSSEGSADDFMYPFYPLKKS